MISAVNGWSVIVFAILCGLVALVFASWSGVIVGLAIAGSGWIEIEGRARLKKRLPEAGKWLTGSQLWFLVVIVFYAGFQLWSFNPSTIMSYIPPELEQLVMRDYCYSPELIERVVTRMFYAVYIGVILGSLVYQGGLFIYYKRATTQLDFRLPD